MKTAQPQKKNEGFIFLSHSHNDIKAVRKIRNRLEEHDFEPLCFYLKCLSDADEIEGLIKREIDAREWFFYLNSENARNSKWVQLERAYIERTNKKKLIQVDLDDPKGVELAIQRIVQGLHVYLSFAHADQAVAHRLMNKLLEKDYILTSSPFAAEITTEYSVQVGDAVSRAAQRGGVIFLLSDAAIHSDGIRKELQIARKKGNLFYPIILGEPRFANEIEELLSDMQYYRLSAEPSEQELDDIVEKISTYVQHFNPLPELRRLDVTDRRQLLEALNNSLEDFYAAVHLKNNYLINDALGFIEDAIEPIAQLAYRSEDPRVSDDCMSLVAAYGEFAKEYAAFILELRNGKSEESDKQAANADVAFHVLSYLAYEQYLTCTDHPEA